MLDISNIIWYNKGMVKHTLIFSSVYKLILIKSFIRLFSNKLTLIYTICKGKRINNKPYKTLLGCKSTILRKES